MAKNLVPRVRRSEDARERIFQKTGGHCHMCGCALDGAWCEDHVVPHASGGKCVEDNFLPACAECNRSRWYATPEQFRQLLKIGIYLFREVRDGTQLGREIESHCQKRDAANHRRRVTQNNLKHEGKPSRSTPSEEVLSDARPADIVQILETALSEPSTPFRAKVGFNGHDITIDFDPVKRKAYPMQFRATGFQIRTCAIGVSELNYGLRKFFTQLVGPATAVPQI